MPEKELPISKIVARIKHLEIRAKKLVEDTLQSDYHSVFKGRGIEFHEARPYLPGDDIRDIDWNVTARMNEPFVKTYIEERQLTVIFAVDISGSMAFGSRRSKRELMAEMVALLGFASFFNNDKAGLILFSDEIEKVLPPVKNHSHLLRIIRETWVTPAVHRETSLSKSLSAIQNLLKKKTIIFLISDFIDSGYEKSLISLSRKHDVIPILLQDPMEKSFKLPHSLNTPVLMDVEDLETGKVRTVDLGINHLSGTKLFEKNALQSFKKLGLDHCVVKAEGDYFQSIETMLRKRGNRVRSA